MPIAFQLGLSGRVVSGDSWATMGGSISNPNEFPATFLGTVDAAAVESYTARSTWHYFRVRLAGEWIPERDLVGDLEITGGIDSTMRTFRFGLRGERWSVFLTEKTWTRTPVEVWTYRGASPSTMIGELEISGYVLTCEQTDDQIRVRCGDAAALFDRFEVCREVEPFAGLSRGEHVEEFLHDAGIGSFEVPTGRVYFKPVQASGRRLFDYLADFIDPEGWFMRWRGPTLTFETIELKERPQPPDDVWMSDVWEQIRIDPPRNGTASRWVVRGSAPVIYFDEQGLETRITETKVRAPYRPRQAIEQQQPDGSVVPLGVTPNAEDEREVSRIVEEQVLRAGQLIRQDVREWGWYNPRAAKLVSDGGVLKPRQVLIDEDGNFVTSSIERFRLISRTVSIPWYDAAGNRIRQSDTRDAFVLRTRGISALGSPDGPYFEDTCVHGDDQSYAQREESFGRLEEIITRFDFDAATGAQWRETRERWTWYAPQCRASGPPRSGWFHLHDGTAQTALEASWRKVGETTTSKTLSADGNVLGETTVMLGYRAPDPVWGGSFEWGPVTANQEEERFRFIEQSSSRYNVLSEDQYEIVRRSSAGDLEVETVSGRLPLPRYLLSAWTSYGQTPFEIVLDDPTIEAWFGFQSEVLQNEFIQNVDEAEQLLARRIRRALARRVEIVRPRTLAREGDTVLLVDPRHGLFHRGLVVRESPRWDLRTGSATAVYELEVYL